MSHANTPQKIARGWVVHLPPEIAQELHVAEGSLALLHTEDGRLEFEILPPLSAGAFRVGARSLRRFATSLGGDEAA